MTDWAEVSGPYSGGTEYSTTVAIDVGDTTIGNILFVAAVAGSYSEEFLSCSGAGAGSFNELEDTFMDDYGVAVFWAIIVDPSEDVTVSADGRVAAVISEWSPPSGTLESDSVTGSDSGATAYPEIESTLASSMFVGGAVSGNSFDDTSGAGTYYYNSFQTGIGGLQLCLIPDATGEQSPATTPSGGGTAFVVDGFAGFESPPDNMVVAFVFEVTAIGV